MKVCVCTYMCACEIEIVYKNEHNCRESSNQFLMPVFFSHFSSKRTVMVLETDCCKNLEPANSETPGDLDLLIWMSKRFIGNLIDHGDTVIQSEVHRVVNDTPKSEKEP